MRIRDSKTYNDINRGLDVKVDPNGELTQEQIDILKKNYDSRPPGGGSGEGVFPVKMNKANTYKSRAGHNYLKMT